MKRLPDITLKQFDPKVLAEDVRKHIIVRVKSSAPEMGLTMLTNAKKITAHRGLAVLNRLIRGYRTIPRVSINQITLILKNIAHAPGHAVRYWRVLYYGRKPGKKPPPYRAILEWGKKTRGWSDNYQDRQSAFMVARNIGIFGTKPRASVFEEIKTRDTIDVVRIMRREIKNG